jgi:hypothetical protein
VVMVLLQSATGMVYHLHVVQVVQVVQVGGELATQALLPLAQLVEVEVEGE